MFHRDFYPTPPGVVRKMISGLKLDVDSFILDPSAGKGDILDVVKARIASNSYKDLIVDKLYAIELNPDLQSILEGKGYPVIHDDFLTYTPRIQFTHILMNPPFGDCERHLMKAWDMMYEGEIVCLLPETSLEGKTVFEKAVLNLIAANGSVEHLGPVFDDAERTTQVNIALVRLHKRAAFDARLEWTVVNDREEPVFEEDKPSEELALKGFIGNLLGNFNAAINHYPDYNRERQRIMHYIQPFRHEQHDREGNSIFINAFSVADKGDTMQERYNLFVSHLQAGAWEAILQHPNFQTMLTDRARKMMAAFRNRQMRVDFNIQNINAMFSALVAKESEIKNGAIQDAFDTMTKHHKYNRVYIKGWMSNEAWKVNRRVVLPNFVSCSYSFSLYYENRDKLDDIDRAMCFVTNKPFNDIVKVSDALNEAFKGSHRRPGRVETEFFDVRYFKVGTIHLRFRDLKELARFNLIAAQGRSWLPPGEGDAWEGADIDK